MREMGKKRRTRAVLRRWLLAVFILASCPAARADEPQPRTWTDATGSFKVEAVFVEQKADGFVVLKGRDGQSLRIKTDQLSPADQAYVRQQASSATKQESPVPETPVTQPSVPAPSKDKPSVPNAKTLEAKSKEVKSLLAADLEASQKNADRRQALRDKLIGLANDVMKSDPAAAYAIMVVGGFSLAGSGDPEKAFELTDWLDEHFLVDDLSALKLEMLRSVNVDSLPAESVGDCGSTIFALMTELEDNANYDGALEAVRLALRVARRAKNDTLMEESKLRMKRLREQERPFAEAVAARAKLRSDPENREAKASLGKFLCLHRGQWERGLPLLAAAADEKLSLLAKRDQANPTVAQEQYSLANAWWELSESPAFRSSAEQLQERAAYWYSAALPGLAGLELVRAKSRTEIKTPNNESEPVDSDARKPKSKPAVFVSLNFPNRCIGHDMTLSLDMRNSAFRMCPGLSGGAGTVSLESVSRPGMFIMLSQDKSATRNLMVANVGNSADERKRATFIKRPGLADRRLLSFESVAQPKQFIIHMNFIIRVMSPEAAPQGLQSATYGLLERR